MASSGTADLESQIAAAVEAAVASETLQKNERESVGQINRRTVAGRTFANMTSGMDVTVMAVDAAVEATAGLEHSSDGRVSSGGTVAPLSARLRTPSVNPNGGVEGETRLGNEHVDIKVAAPSDEVGDLAYGDVPTCDVKTHCAESLVAPTSPVQPYSAATELHAETQDDDYPVDHPRQPLHESVLGALRAEMHERDRLLEDQRSQLSALQTEVVRLRSNQQEHFGNTSDCPDVRDPAQNERTSTPGHKDLALHSKGCIASTDSPLAWRQHNTSKDSPPIFDNTPLGRIEELEAELRERASMIQRLENGFSRLRAVAFGRPIMKQFADHEMPIVQELEQAILGRDARIRELTSAAAEAKARAEQLRITIAERDEKTNEKTNETRGLSPQCRQGSDTSVSPPNAQGSPRDTLLSRSEDVREMCVRIAEQATLEVLERESAQRAIRDRQFQARIEADLERTRHSVFTALANGSTPPRTPHASKASLLSHETPRTKSALEVPLVSSQVFLHSGSDEHHQTVIVGSGGMAVSCPQRTNRQQPSIPSPPLSSRACTALGVAQLAGDGSATAGVRTVSAPCNSHTSKAMPEAPKATKQEPMNSASNNQCDRENEEVLKNDASTTQATVASPGHVISWRAVPADLPYSQHGVPTEMAPTTVSVATAAASRSCRKGQLVQPNSSRLPTSAPTKMTSSAAPAAPQVTSCNTAGAQPSVAGVGSTMPTCPRHPCGNSDVSSNSYVPAAPVQLAEIAVATATATACHAAVMLQPSRSSQHLASHIHQSTAVPGVLRSASPPRVVLPRSASPPVAPCIRIASRTPRRTF